MKLIKENPCAAVERPKHRRSEIEPFTAEEANAILRQVEGKPLAGVFHLALKVGLRQEEVFGLRWEDVNFEACEVSIRQAAVEVGGRTIIKEPKNAASVRTVPIDADTLHALHLRRLYALKKGFAASSLVFCSQAGQAMRRSNFGARHWKPVLRALKLSVRGFHHCRHTAATAMLKGGVPLHVVSRVLGHAKAETTANIYAHYASQDGREAVEFLQKTFSVGGSVGGAL